MHADKPRLQNSDDKLKRLRRQRQSKAVEVEGVRKNNSNPGKNGNSSTNTRKHWRFNQLFLIT